MDGSEVRPNGIPNALVAYWNKKNGLSIDSMPGLRLADDLSTALVPPFKLESASTSGGEDKHTATDVKTVSSITRAYLYVSMASCFILGMVAMYAFQSTSRHLVAI